MNLHLISDLGRFVDGRGVILSEAPGHVELQIVRSEISLSVLVPRAVLEWWVEVKDASNEKRIADWCDYAGYDATTKQELSEDMRNDVLRFVENILARPLRLVENGRKLQWHVGRHWLQAVPLVAEAELGSADDVRNARA